MAASELNHFRKKLVKKYNIPTDFLGNVKKSDKEGTFEESVNEGASSHDLQNAILYRVEMRHPELFSKYGLEYVADKALDVASFYAGAEEIGSSDMSAMVNHLVKTLEHEGEHGLDENLDANQIHAGQLGPTEKVGPRGAVGKLVGANESVNESEDELARILQMVKHKR